MPDKRMGWIGLAALVLSGSGCCSFWERHCAPAHPVAPAACVPYQQPVCCPTYAPPPPPAAGCPAGCAPINSQWQRPPY